MGLHYQETSVWNRSIEVITEVYRLLPLLPREEVYGVRSQITRASVSVASNIAEGWSRETHRDRAHFLAIAQGSLAETETLITVCERLGWMTKEQTATVRGLIVEVSKMLNTLRKQHREKEAIGSA